MSNDRSFWFALLGTSIISSHCTALSFIDGTLFPVVGSIIPSLPCLLSNNINNPSIATMMPSPASLIRGGEEKLPEVEQMGTISLEELNKYHCKNPDRRLMSLFGVVYDVTSSLKSYGPEGAYKEYAGHDITLALAKHKTDEKWLDRFVKMEEKWKADAKGWADYFAVKYPVCGKLDKWENEDPDSWPELTEEELKDLEKCVIM